MCGYSDVVQRKDGVYWCPLCGFEADELWERDMRERVKAGLDKEPPKQQFYPNHVSKEQT